MLDEGDKMLDDGFEEEVVLIGGEALRTKTQTQYCTGSCLNHFFPGASCDVRGGASEFLILLNGRKHRV